jgi:hypothetical protein
MTSASHLVRPFVAIPTTIHSHTLVVARDVGKVPISHSSRQCSPSFPYDFPSKPSLNS